MTLGALLLAFALPPAPTAPAVAPPSAALVRELPPAAAGPADAATAAGASRASRFTRPDPLYINRERILEPQRLDLYAYARKNPLRFTDPLGLDVTCTGTNCQDYLAYLQKSLSFQIAYDKNQTIQVVGEVGRLKGKEKELYAAITDTKHHVTMERMEHNGEVFMGVFDGGGKQRLDVADVRLLDADKNEGGVSAAGVVAHETIEAFYGAKGAGYGTAHDVASYFAPGLRGFGGSRPVPDQSGNSYIGFAGDFAVDRTDIVERVGFLFDTPIPREDFLRVKQLAHPALIYPRPTK